MKSKTEGAALPPTRPQFKPVFQTIHEHLNGNCFQACVASIMGLDLDAVPHFMSHCAGDKWTQEQWDAVREFANDHGFNACWIDNPEEPELVSKLMASDLYYIGIGKSRAGDWGHCVVMRKGENVHDPANGGFLASEPWTFVVFEAVADPVRRDRVPEPQPELEKLVSGVHGYVYERMKAAWMARAGGSETSGAATSPLPCYVLPSGSVVHRGGCGNCSVYVSPSSPGAAQPVPPQEEK